MKITKQVIGSEVRIHKRNTLNFWKTSMLVILVKYSRDNCQRDFSNLRVQYGRSHTISSQFQMEIKCILAWWCHLTLSEVERWGGKGGKRNRSTGVALTGAHLLLSAGYLSDGCGLKIQRWAFKFCKEICLFQYQNVQLKSL